MVGLLRASGVPSRYVSGTLGVPKAQELILSMFPEPLRITGLVPAGAEVGDPANDPKLLAETRDHFWVQLDTGLGFQEADPTFVDAVIGDTFTTANNVFAEVDDALRHKVRLQLDRELANTGAAALFGLNPLGTATVLDVTFNSVELVGRPLSIGHFVSRQTLVAPIVTTVINTYSPYVAVGDYANSIAEDQVLHGTDYQEVITSFPFGTQVLTGLFLKLELSGPDGPRETFERPLVDLIGYDVRTNGGTPNLTFDPNGPPTLTPFDVFTVNVLPNEFSTRAGFLYAKEIASLQAELDRLSPGGQVALDGPTATVVGQLVTARTRMSAAEVFNFSDLFTEELANAGIVRAYFDRPRIVLTTNRLHFSGGPQPATTFSSAIDLRRDTIRVVVPPGQNRIAAQAFQIARGMVEGVVETELAAMQLSQVPDAPEVVSTARVISEALATGISLMPIGAENLSELDAAPFSAEAKARITASVTAGKAVLVPERPVTIGGEDHIAWYEIDPVSGETIAVTEDGGHQATVEYAAALAWSAAAIGIIYGMVSYIDHLGDCFTGSNLQHCKDELRDELGHHAPLHGATSALLAPFHHNLLVSIYEAFAWAAFLFEVLVVNINDFIFDPPLPEQFISPRPLVDFTGVPGTGVTTKVVVDPFFTLPFGGAQLPVVFRVGIKNEQSIDDRFDVQVSHVPPGWEAVTSVSDIGVPAGSIAEVGLVLRPTGILPPPGTDASFTVTVSSTSNPAVTDTFVATFLVPEVPGIEVSLEPPPAATIPGVSVDFNLVVRGVGNVTNTVTFEVTLPNGLTLDGLTSIVVNPGQTVVQTLTLTPATGTPLNSTLSATITVNFGAPEPQTHFIPIRVAAPGAEAISKAALAAGQLDNLELAGRLNDLSVAITNLVQQPGNSVFHDQALNSLDSVLTLVVADPMVVDFAGPLTAARPELEAAGTPEQIQNAVQSLGNALDTFAAHVTALSRHNVSLFLNPNARGAVPLVPQTFDVIVQNVGSQSTTYDLSVSGLPADVQSEFSQTSITLDRNEIQTVTLTLTQTSTSNLDAFGFTVDAAFTDGVTITRSAHGSVTPRNEFVSVVDVVPNPSFADPGDSVAVRARLLNAVNQQLDALATYRVLDANQVEVLARANPVPVTLNVVTSLVDVNLGTLDTTGFALGQYTVEVTVTDTMGDPIPGATGTGVLLIGSPVKADLTVGPTTLPPGTGTVTNTLQIDANVSLADPLCLVSLTGPGALGSARHGDLIYVARLDGVHIYNISDPENPQFIRTFGTEGLHADRDTLVVRGDLLVYKHGHLQLSTYSLAADPQNPTRLGSTPVIAFGPNGQMKVTDTHVYLTSLSFVFLQAGQDVVSHEGVLLSINITDPANPFLEDVLDNTFGTFNDGVGVLSGVDRAGGPFNVWEVEQVDANTLYMATTTVTGGNVNAGVGRIQIVDVSNPADMVVVGELQIPGTVHVTGLDIEGDRAFVVGSTGGWTEGNLSRGLSGNVVLGTLDISDPRNPQLLHTQTLTRRSRGLSGLSQIGPNLHAFSSLGDPLNGETSAQLILVSTSDPMNLVPFGTDVVSELTPTITASDGLIYTTANADGLMIFELSGRDFIPVTAEVRIPNNTGVRVVANSFSTPPTRIIPGTEFDRYVFNLALTSRTPTQTITWQSTVTNLQPGEARDVTLASTIDFTSQGTSGQVTLPPQNVFAEQILALNPAAQTVQPGAAAMYNVTVANPTAFAVTYGLSVTGVPQEWVEMAAQVTVPAGGAVNVPLTLTASPFAVVGDRGFVVNATDGGATGSVQGTLTLAGVSVLPAADPVAHGVVVGRTPSQQTAGQGTAAVYTVRVTNTGSQADTFDLAVLGLPPGITTTLARPAVTVPPGASNFREVTLTLAVPAGITPAEYPFQVTATSRTPAGATDTADGSLVVLANGVDVTLSPDASAPGGGFQLTVANTGQVTDTFDLELAGPAALVANLGTRQVTLAPGASQVVPITAGAVTFALPGSLNLTAMAKSRTDPGVRDSDTSEVMVPTSHGMTTHLEPAVQVLPLPGTSSFLVMVHNTGNGEDAYSAVITDMDGPVTASFDGLDGQPTQAIPTFRLPALSTGALLLRTNLASTGQGTVTVRVQSLTDGSRTVSVTATVTAVMPSRQGPGPEPTPAPSVLTGVQVLRSGRKGKPTGLVLTFRGSLDPAVASLVRNYNVYVSGKRKQKRRPRLVQVLGAVYNPSQNTVILRIGKLLLPKRIGLLEVVGLTDPLGGAFDGNRDGQPGGQSVILVNLKSRRQAR